jgi:hypothetical protein
VTVQPAAGLDGPVAVLFVAVDAGRAADVQRELDALAPGAFRASYRLRSASWAPLPPGYLVMTTGARLTRRTRLTTAEARP